MSMQYEGYQSNKYYIGELLKYGFVLKVKMGRNYKQSIEYITNLNGNHFSSN